MILKVFGFFCLVSFALAAEAIDGDPQPSIRSKVKYLEADSTIHYTPPEGRSFFENDLRIYCHRGNPKTVSRLFETIEMQFDIEGDDYTQYEGETADQVLEHYEERRSLFSLSLFSQKRTRLQMSPFVQQCIGIETTKPYRVRLAQAHIDFWRVSQLIIAIFVFTYAGTLSKNSLFYYTTGVVVGICSSFMLLIWLTSKLLPRKTMVYGALVGGWAIGLYVIQMLWQNLQVIILTYKTYVFWYLLITGFISFFFCYRWGPPKNERSKNIIKWLLQLISAVMIYFSSQYEEGSVALVLLTLFMNYFPHSIWWKCKGHYLRLFPPKKRYLTNEEYYEQGVRETTKALDDLRSYASSPECNSWKVMSRLKDPYRFAAFVEGASHLKDEEILRFEGSHYGDDFTDESDSNIEDNEIDLDNEEDDESELYYSRGSNVNYSIDRRRATIRKNFENNENDDLPYSQRTKRTSLELNSRASSRNSLRSPQANGNDSITRRRTPTRSAQMVQAAIQNRRSMSRRKSPPRQNEYSDQDDYND